MGLDMYFYARKEMYSYREDIEYPEQLKGFEKYITEKNFKSKTETESYQIGYFRKFNALHGYIINNYAGGEDECQEIYLDKKQIEELLKVCKEVNEHRDQANNLLPTQDGFFFGSAEYDGYYFEDIKDAIDLFSLILATIDFDNWAVIYHASW